MFASIILAASIFNNLINDLNNFKIEERSSRFVVNHWGDSKTPASGMAADCVGCEVSLIVTTDVDYLVETSFVQTNSKFYFSTFRPGAPRIELIDHDGESYVTSNLSGRLKSYRVEDDYYKHFLHERLWLYDLAVVIIAGTNVLDKKTITPWVATLLESISDIGEFPFFINGRSGEIIDEYYRTGTQFWCLYALAWYQQHYSDNPAQTKIISTINTTTRTLIREYYDTSTSLFRGGRGRYLANYTRFDKDYMVSWHSTEHNIDAYFALRLIREVLDTDEYDTAITLLEAALLGMYRQSGIALQGLGDPSQALDCASWYSLFLQSVGKPDMQIQAAIGTDKFKNPDGHTPYLQGYPMTDKSVAWLEGMAGVMLAKQQAGMTQEAIDILKLIEMHYGGSLPYVNKDLPELEMYAWNSLASVAWTILALSPNGFWETENCTETISLKD